MRALLDHLGISTFPTRHRQHFVDRRESKPLDYPIVPGQEYVPIPARQSAPDPRELPGLAASLSCNTIQNCSLLLLPALTSGESDFGPRFGLRAAGEMSQLTWHLTGQIGVVPGQWSGWGVDQGPGKVVHAV